MRKKTEQIFYSKNDAIGQHLEARFEANEERLTTLENQTNIDVSDPKGQGGYAEGFVTDQQSIEDLIVWCQLYLKWLTKAGA